jgi:hypothetical protein
MACLERSLDSRKADPLACTDNQNGRHWYEHFLRVPTELRDKMRRRPIAMTSALDPRYAFFTALMADRLAAHILQQPAQVVEFRSET